jgi:hypothetical protein
MKKPGKLSINPEKVIKNDELVNLRGGYQDPYEGTCAYHIVLGGTEICQSGISRYWAIYGAQCEDRENGTNCVGNWCCDSCGQVGWLPC